jgi:hypothetical protein
MLLALLEERRRRLDGIKGDNNGESVVCMARALRLWVNNGVEYDFARRSYGWHRSAGEMVSSPVLAARSAAGIAHTATTNCNCIIN